MSFRLLFILVAFVLAIMSSCNMDESENQTPTTTHEFKSSVVRVEIRGALSELNLSISRSHVACEFVAGDRSKSKSISSDIDADAHRDIHDVVQGFFHTMTRLGSDGLDDPGAVYMFGLADATEVYFHLNLGSDMQLDAYDVFIEKLAKQFASHSIITSEKHDTIVELMSRHGEWD